MAKPRKQTVDYFPHPVNNGSRMFIMEQTYGDKGYCCYYKTLEMLGKSEGHFIDLSINKNKMYFSAILRCNESELMAMMNTLCVIGAIDKDLWEQKSIVWCQEFVDKLTDLYDRRKCDIPTKETLFDEKTYPHEELYNKKQACRNKTHHLIKSGEIKKQPCEVCNSETSEAHHKNYDDPYDIQWLCRKHHAEIHSQNRAIGEHNENILPQTKLNKSKEKKTTLNQNQPASDEFKELILPYNSEQFKKIWGVLRQEKKWKNKSFAALQTSLMKLGRYPEEDAIEMMNNALAGGWQGLFELEKYKNGKSFNNNSAGVKSSGANFNSTKSEVAELVERSRQAITANNSANT